MTFVYGPSRSRLGVWSMASGQLPLVLRALSAQRQRLLEPGACLTFHGTGACAIRLDMGVLRGHPRLRWLVGPYNLEVARG